MLAFTSVYFFESRLFNGLRPIQIKKSPSSRLACQAACETCRASASPFWTLENLRISIKQSIRRDRGLAKDLFAATWARQSKGPAPPMVWRRQGQKWPIAGYRRLWGSPASPTGCQRFPSGGRRGRVRTYPWTLALSRLSAKAGECVLGRNILRPAVSRGHGHGAVERLVGVGKPAPESPNTAIVGACLIAQTPA